MWSWFSSIFSYLFSPAPGQNKPVTAPQDTQVTRTSSALAGGPADWWKVIATALVANGVDVAATLFLVAEVQLENSRDLRSLYNFNVGNVKLPSYKVGTGVSYYVLTDRQTSTDRYESFPDLRAGMAEYIKEMVRRRPTAYARAVAQDLEGYVQSLYYGESGSGKDGYIGPDARIINGWHRKDGTVVQGIGLAGAIVLSIRGDGTRHAPGAFYELTGDGTLADMAQLVKEGRPFYDAFVQAGGSNA